MSERPEILTRKRVELELTPIEMTYVARLIGMDSLFGIGDPFFGWLTEEIREAWSEAHRDLKARKVIEEGPEGMIRVDVIAGGALAVCSRPEARLILQVREKGRDEQALVFHFTRGLCVGHQVAMDAREPVTLTLFEGPADMGEEIASIVGLSGGEKAGSIHLRSSMDLLWSAVETAEKDPDKLSGVVNRLCKEGEGAAELEGTLQGPFRYASMVRMVERGEEAPPRAVAVLAGERYLWEIRPDLSGEQVAIDMSLVEPEGAKAAFLGMIGA